MLLHMRLLPEVVHVGEGSGVARVKAVGEGCGGRMMCRCSTGGDLLRRERVRGSREAVVDWRQGGMNARHLAKGGG